MLTEINYQNLNIEEKINAALAETAWDCLVVFGWDNVQYLSGAQIPFIPYRHDERVAVCWSKNSEPVYICPKDIESSVAFFSRIGKIESYVNGGYCSNNYMDAVARAIGDAKTVAIDMKRVSHVCYEKLMDRKPDIRVEAADEWLENQRMNKTEGEQQLLSDIAYTADHSINGFCHHIMKNGIRSMESHAAALRVHAMERNVNNIGYSCTAQITGHELGRYYWPVQERLGANYGYSPDEKLHGDDLVRASVKVTFEGYWADASRPYTYDQMEPWMEKYYGQWFNLRNYMLGIIRSGISCKEVYEKTAAYAAEKGIKLADNYMLGHSIGVSIFEHPFIDGVETTDIQDGMIFVLTPIVIAENGQHVQSYETILMKEGKPVVVNWWKDWREPYIGIAVV